MNDADHQAWTDIIEEADAASLDRKLGEARLAYVRAHKANEAKLTQLVYDAQAKHDEADTEDMRHYYCGWADGMRRALNVLQGKG